MTTTTHADPPTEASAKNEATEEKGVEAPDPQALSALISPVRGAIVTAVLLQIVGSVAAIAPYIGIAELAKLFIAQGAAAPAGTVWAIAGVVVGGFVLRTVLSGGALSVTHFADTRMQGILRRRIVERLGRVPLGWFTQHSSGLVRKATQNDINDIHYLVAHGAVETTAAITVPLAGIGYLLWLDWRLAILGVITIPIYLAVYASMTRGLGEKMREMNAGIAKISQTIVEFVSGIAVVKTFGQTGRAHQAYREAAIEFGDAYGAWVRPMLRTDALATIAISAPVVLLVNLIGSTWFVSSGWVNPVDAVVAALVAMTLPTAIMTVSFSMQARRQAAAAAGRLVTLLDTPVLPEPADPQTPTSAQVRFEGVGFSYDGEHRVLNDITLDLEPGTVTALVGPSGSGKSTLATLLARFHDVEAGRILLGGVDLRNIATAELYRHVGMVLQDVQLVRASVADNIRLALPDASLEQVRTAARAAQIDERILALPRGYDSVIGEDALLSGGEGQRVSIARAILADPPVLILDEATAFADPESEARIQDALAHLVPGRTLLVIAHRLATIAGADRIVVLDRGRVAESGTHEELLAEAGLYARMWRAYEPTPDHEGALA